jgi:hypothetical protein
MFSFTSTSTRVMTLAIGAAALAVACTPSGAEEGKAASSADDGIAILSPTHNSEVGASVEFEISTGDVDTTGDTVDSDAGGAFWLVVDADCVDVGERLPVEEPGHHRVPDGATTLTIELTPGTHDVCLQFADASNVTYYEVDDVTISVKG